VHSEIFYYKTKNGREVDFIVQMQDRSRILVQVCESMADAKTQKRELAALCEAMNELGLKTAIIVTRNQTERITVEGCNVKVVPAWRFLLEIPKP
jgi:predicted AAA+ superfamily ATPase